MNRATKAALINIQANPFDLRAALFHSTPVLDRRRRNHWDSEIILEKLQRMANSGIPDGGGLRATTWKVKLQVYAFSESVKMGDAEISLVVFMLFGVLIIAIAEIYIVTVEGEPDISYRGGVDGFEATAVEYDEELDVASWEMASSVEKKEEVFSLELPAPFG